MINEKKWQQLQDRMLRLGINEASLVEQFIIGAGSGGQKLHKTSSCVLLIDSASGNQIKCQASRARETNRYEARVRLCQRV